MRLSTRTRYGLRAMVQLAAHRGDGPLGLGTIAEAQELSSKYLHTLMTSLRSAGLVRSTRGTKGGFRIARPAAEITLSEVVRALEGPISLVDCVEQPEACILSEGCVTREVWVEMATALHERLEAVTLEDLVDRQAAKDASRGCAL